MILQPKYKLNEIAQFISNEIFSPFPISNSYVDSRLVKKGGLFFALPGNKVDGHSFLGEAAQKGAVAAVVHKDYTGPHYGLILIKVSDPLLAMQNMARQLLLKRKAKVVAITGSVGKTTTKEFVLQLLKQKYRITASPGNNNSQIGLPLVILNHMEGNEEILILEMGMNKAGQIKNLVDIAPPEVSIITQTALVHAENFSSIEAIGLAKSEIFLNSNTRLGIINRDIINFQEICRVGKCPKMSFSINNLEADLSARKLHHQLEIHFQNEKVLLPLLPVRGEHNVVNFLAAIAVAKYFKVGWEQIRNAIPSLDLPKGRFEVIEKKGIVFINDAYNASEISVKAALKSLPDPSSQGKRIAILGDMLELGKFSKQCHEEIGIYSLNYVQHMICLGEQSKAIYDIWHHENKPVYWKSNLDEVIETLRSIVNPGDVVLLKGSSAKELWKVLDAI